MHDTALLHAHGLTLGPIQNLTFAWPAGVSWVCGDEGAGKTTLLRLLSGDAAPTSGTLHRPQGGVFWGDLRSPAHDGTTVQACWDGLRTRCPQWSEDLFQDLSDALDMNVHRAKTLHMLSTGSRRKVMLVAALASGATVTLLDQPFVSLDQVSVRVILDFLREAAGHTERAWIVADYETPQDMPLASLLQL